MRGAPSKSLNTLPIKEGIKTKQHDLMRPIKGRNEGNSGRETKMLEYNIDMDLMWTNGKENL